MHKTWLVTGGCGFLGSNLVASLLKDGIEVVVADNLARSGAEQNLKWLGQVALDAGVPMTFSRIDVRDASQVDRLFTARPGTIDTVAHLAGQVAMTSSVDNPRHDFEVNALGALNVLEAVRIHAPEAVALYSSTNKVYGELAGLVMREAATRWELVDFPEGLSESTPISLETPYGCSKGSADQYFQDYGRTYGLKTLVFRHGSMYGARQFATGDQGWIAWFCAQALEQRRTLKRGDEVRPFSINGDGKQVRDVLEVSDAVACYRMAATSATSSAVFNVGGGPLNAMSLLELFARLEAILGIELRYTNRPWRHRDQRVYVSDIRRIASQIGWRPSVTIDDGIARTLVWCESSVS